MKLFTCSACGHTVYFHNVACTHCGASLGFVPDILQVQAFDRSEDGLWHLLGADSEQTTYRPCANHVDHNACNWMVPAATSDPLCVACGLNRTIPDLSIAHNLELWRRLQREKNRLVYGLLRLGLPLMSKRQSPDQGLAFDFLSATQPRFREDSDVITGHAHGLITLDIAEADDAVRERVRQDMAEPYRTLLGHFRHESGHYYWDRLVRGTDRLAAFRERFGDERADYDAALRHHYAEGPPGDWTQRFISSYASSHPWEDWAETWAHYLHMIDTLETAWQFGLRLAPQGRREESLTTDIVLDPYAGIGFGALIGRWMPVTVALNSLNQSMGQPDAYPFVLSQAVTDKLELVHEIVHDGSR